MDNKLDIDNLFGDDPELDALFKSVMAQTNSSSEQQDTGEILMPGQLFESSPADMPIEQTLPYTYMPPVEQPVEQIQPKGDSQPHQTVEPPSIEDMMRSWEEQLTKSEVQPLPNETSWEFDLNNTSTTCVDDVEMVDVNPSETLSQTADEIILPEEPVKVKSTGMKIVGLIFNCLFYLMCISMVVGSALFAFSNDPGKSYFNYRLYSVKTPSMKPQPDGPSGGFYAGDMIVVHMVKPETVEVGDIITFVPQKDRPDTFLTHRVVEIKQKLTNDPNEAESLYFVTRGDANDTDDPPISADMVIGKKVVSVRYAGNVIQVVRGNLIPIVIFIVILFAFVFTLRLLFSDPKKKEEKKENKKRDPTMV